MNFDLLNLFLTGGKYVLWFFAAHFALYYIVAFISIVATNTNLKETRKHYDKESRETIKKAEKRSNEEEDSGKRQE